VIPLALVAELTHRCPLKCLYCSNPAELSARESELATSDWLRVIDEAAGLGMHQIHFTGGEPLQREDLEDLVARARYRGLYSNLITSGIGLDSARLDRLSALGLDHVQLSFQSADETRAREISGTRSHQRKLEVARLLREASVSFSINVVLHKLNLDELPAILKMIEVLAPDKVELAHTQYYGWAFKNRALLIPTPEQIESSKALIAEATRRLEGKVRVEFVQPDYFGKFPKPCMGGWAMKTLVLHPDGRALPCHSASVIPGLVFDNVREKSLSWIWENSEPFLKFRGDSIDRWMKEPCRSCEHRTRDFGGCRCQAFLYTGDAAATDPACSRSPDHALLAAPSLAAPQYRGAPAT
jgi:pyrroloquinoline quinone biosynthesis protein E